MVLGTFINIVILLFVLLLKLITQAPAPAPMRHVTSLKLNVVITHQIPQHSAGSSSPSTGRDPAQVGLAVHATPPLAVLERHILAVREDIVRIEGMEDVREMGPEGAGEDLLEAGADGSGAVARADSDDGDEPGHRLDLQTQQELLAQFRRSVEAGAIIEGLGEVMRTWRSQAIGSCPCYTPSVR
jgi:hypothetical protein